MVHVDMADAAGAVGVSTFLHVYQHISFYIKLDSMVDLILCGGDSLGSCVLESCDMGITCCF